MKLSFLIFLMLVITHTALSVPVDEKTYLLAKSDYKELFKTPVEINKKFKALFDEHQILIYRSESELDVLEYFIISDFREFKTSKADVLNHINSAETKKKMQDFLDEFSNIKVEESSTHLKLVLKDLVKYIHQDLVDVKAKISDILNHINLARTKKNLQDILDILANIKIKYYLDIDPAWYFLGGGYFDAEAKFNAILNQINSTETKTKLQKIFNKLCYVKLYETTKILYKQMVNFIKEDLLVVQNKFDDIWKEINPSEIKKKFQNLYKQISAAQIDGLDKSFEEKLKNITQQESPDLKTKVDEILNQIDSAETIKKLQDLLYELSILNSAELFIRFEKRLKNFVQEELSDVKAKFDEILVQINSAKTKQKMQDLFDHFSITKLAEISKVLIARLAS